MRLMEKHRIPALVCAIAVSTAFSITAHCQTTIKIINPSATFGEAWFETTVATSFARNDDDTDDPPADFELSESSLSFISSTVNNSAYAMANAETKCKGNWWSFLSPPTGLPAVVKGKHRSLFRVSGESEIMLIDPPMPFATSEVSGDTGVYDDYTLVPPKGYPGHRNLYTLEANYMIFVSCPFPQGVRNGTVLVGEISNVSNFRTLSKIIVKHVGGGQFTVEGEHWGTERDDGGPAAHTPFGPTPITGGFFPLKTFNIIARSEKFRVRTVASALETGGNTGILKVAAGFVPIFPPPPVVPLVKGEINAEIEVEFTVTDYNYSN